MAIVYETTLQPSKLDLLADWIGDQRWYTGKAHTPDLQRLGFYRFDDPDGEVGIEVLVVADSGGADEPVVYQIPVTWRGEPVDELRGALIGTTEHGTMGTRYAYDGCHDPAFAEAMLRCVITGSTQAALEIHDKDGNVTRQQSAVRVKGSGVRHTEMPTVIRSRVLSGEQSNTSIIYEVNDVSGAPASFILKMFRVLHDGENPDVVLQGALSDAGSDAVPAMLGSVLATWPAPGGRNWSGHVAFAQEFLPGVQDAWREASAAAVSGADFTRAARDLGAATANVHAALATALGAAPASASDTARTVLGMSERFARACERAPELAAYDDAFQHLMAVAKDADWPQRQRIHGDYHLGQVLEAPSPAGNRWVLIDFEGEPLRPLAERNEFDSPLRDVAGMLRSFDYAAGAAERETAEDRRDWATATRSAFVQGYVSSGGLNLAAYQDILDAFEIDKASYEIEYEARNRPSWLAIPTTAIHRLLAGERQTDVPVPATNTPSGPTMASIPPLNVHEADALLMGTHGDPHSVLGGQTDELGPFVRALRPFAESVQALLEDGTRVSLVHEYEGIWTGRLPLTELPDYRLITTFDDGYEHVQDDPYRFLPSLGDIDLFLIGEGRHEELWKILGAHVQTYDGPLGRVTGTSFAVWAPHAKGVQVIGDFNFWNGEAHAMRQLGNSGVWELFVPGVNAGTSYKFKVCCADRVWRDRADPMARASEDAPATASVVTQTAYEWGDGAWLTKRGETDPHTQPMSVYELHLGSWRQGLSYRDMAEHLVNYVSDLGFTHVELMPVMQHPFPPSWGYHVTGYYAPNSRFGTPDDFRYLVDKLHQAGIGVILDWVPGHFATDEWALAKFDGTSLYEHPDPRKGWHKEWGSYVFDFGRPHVRNFLFANALYWLEEFHADGLRVDGVASMLYLDYSREDGEWIPNIYGGRENLDAVKLLQETNATAYRRNPGTVMIAEESTSWPGVTQPTSSNGLGFGFKWNMGWMNDSLGYIENPPIYRKYHHGEMTFALVYAWSEQFMLPISHDEVVHGKGSLLRKMPGDRWEQLANVRAYIAYMWSHPGKQLLFMGQEFAQEAEWADGRSLDWWLLDQPAHYGVHALVKDLNRLYIEHPALWELDHEPRGFGWIDADDGDQNTFSFLRFGTSERDVVAVVVNFSGSEHRDVRVGLPHEGVWTEALNTDAAGYGGGGRGNLGSVTAEPIPANGQPFSATVTMPPLAALWFTPDHTDSITVTDVQPGVGTVTTPLASTGQGA